MDFPKISSTARNDLFFAKLAHDCLIQAQEHLARAIKNQEEAGGTYLDRLELLDADRQIEQASEALVFYAGNTLDQSPEAR